jgi:hypothetical protein
MKNLTMLLLFLIVSSTTSLFAQAQPKKPDTLSTFISLQYGIGKFAVTDKYISGEKYSGTLPLLGISWMKKHDTYLYLLSIEYRNSDQIKNNNAFTDITQFTLNQGFLYKLKNYKLFNKDLYAWIGPETEVYLFYNNPEVAVSGFDFAQSLAALISLGINTKANYPISDSFQIESGLKLTVLSLGFRMVDSEDDDTSPAKLLTFLAGLNSSFDIGIRYRLINHISISLGYKFEYTRISAWDELSAASDNFIAGLSYHF